VRALIQRVSEARVVIDDEVTGSIRQGILILLGVHVTDDEAAADWLARKCASLRIFPDDEGRMNVSAVDAGVEALVVSQFTLYGDAARGNRPSYTEAAGPDVAVPLYERFVGQLGQHLGRTVATGRFGAMMQVHLVNDGPVTILVEKAGG
jgi:D-aminoacyl-tRNA deacylase